MKFCAPNSPGYLDGVVSDIILSPSDKQTYIVTLSYDTVHQLTEVELEAYIPPLPAPPNLPPGWLPAWLSPDSKATYKKDGQYHHLYISQHLITFQLESHKPCIYKPVWSQSQTYTIHDHNLLRNTSSFPVGPHLLFGYLLSLFSHHIFMPNTFKRPVHIHSMKLSTLIVLIVIHGSVPTTMNMMDYWHTTTLTLLPSNNIIN